MGLGKRGRLSEAQAREMEQKLVFAAAPTLREPRAPNQAEAKQQQRAASGARTAWKGPMSYFKSNEIK
jgi:hypothetical protein